MNQTPKPDSENVPLDAEDFEIAFKPYGAYPDAALDLARRFITIKEFLQSQPPDIPQAMAALDEAVDVLFPLTRFHKAGYDLYRTYIEGRATRAHEAQMESLGIRF